jgi:hypothetical protein
MSIYKQLSIVTPAHSVESVRNKNYIEICKKCVAYHFKKIVTTSLNLFGAHYTGLVGDGFVIFCCED